MLSESAGIVETCFGIPVTFGTLIHRVRLAIRQRPGDSFFTEDFLAVDDGRYVGFSGTITVCAVLVRCIFGVI